MARIHNEKEKEKEREREKGKATMGSWLPTKLKAREESKSSRSFDEKVLSANPRIETREEARVGASKIHISEREYLPSNVFAPRTSIIRINWSARGFDN